MTSINNILLPVFFFVSATAFAQNELLVRLEGAPKWELGADVRLNFDSFLQNERLDLLKKIPGLDFPDSFASMKEGMFEYAVASEKNYKNRSTSCSFLEKVKRTLSSQDLIAFNEIFRNGQVCTPGDLPEIERSQWMMSLIQFLWLKPWISSPNSKVNLSLEDLIISRIGSDPYQRPQFHILTSVPFDGYGYNYSAHDRMSLAANPLLNKVFDIAKNYTPNNPSSLGDLGDEAKALVNESPTGAGGFFVLGPSIYVTNNWAPEALVELLVHEYGHVLQGNLQTKLIDKGNLIEVTNDSVLNEGGAEAVAWQVLCGVYDEYPEIKFFHVLKLKLFSQWKKSDSHLVGAAAFAEQFHYACQNQPDSLLGYLRSNSLADYMKSVSQFPLMQIGVGNSKEVRLKWQ